MSTFTDSFEVPIAATIDGKEYQLRPLTIRDYLPWCADLARQFQDRNLKLLPTTLKPLERMNAESSIRAREFTPDDIKALVFHPSGMERIIRSAVIRAVTGKPATEPMDEAAKKLADSFIDDLTSKDAEALAMRLSGLYLQYEIEEWLLIPQRARAKREQEKLEGKAGDAPPNDPAAGSAAAT